MPNPQATCGMKGSRAGRFAGVAPDGTLACISGEASDAEIVLTPPGGAASSIDTGIEFAGHVEFVNGSSLLTYCTSDGNSATDGSNAGWTEELWTVALGPSVSSPKLLISGDGWWCEDGAVVGANSMVELVGVDQVGTPSMALVDLTTRKSTVIAPADTILGVL